MMLEYFKYPEQFLRKTKHAFVSIVDDSIIELAQNTSQRSYNSTRMLLRKQGIEMYMAYCRKIFATYLRNNGIQPEMIDLLQGRVPKSVFMRHYYRPSDNYDGLRMILNSLKDELFS
jgi:intergrase/recombinase